MEEAIDCDKVFLAVMQIRQNLQIDSVPELERAGLEKVCRDCNVDYEDFTEAERDEIWKEFKIKHSNNS
jgi:hypothetical protein